MSHIERPDRIGRKSEPTPPETLLGNPGSGIGPTNVVSRRSRSEGLLLDVMY
ncbi:hypothetical protein SAMN05443544_2264 [Agromyces cerinus subsp. cerinus]|uniref:Uncharacterized protein n=1 Tax=Agromyces cerinus subsp. cerinus TaxID=232089 RepID=A0A1N6G3G4_9MICO|nr:hypothetical protein SAMN05443544_2264 [Agromyces cerinus subsp. cerinus]